jgi:GxxExxY protein
MIEDDLLVDEEMEPNPALNRITNAIIGAAIAVHRILGPGFLESVHQKALEIELRARNVLFVPQFRIKVSYKNQQVGEDFLDFLGEGSVVVELKAVESLGAIHTAYLRASKQRLGLLINFNVRMLKNGIKRIAL